MSRSDRVKTRLDRWASLNPGATDAERDRKEKRIAERLRAEQDAEEWAARRLEEARSRQEAELAKKLADKEEELDG